MSLDPNEHVPPAPHMNATVLHERNEVRLWYKGGHYTKIVLETEGDLSDVSGYLGARGFKNAVIVDEGRTELDPFTPTAIGCAIVDKDNPHVQATFGEFGLYRDKPTYVVLDSQYSPAEAEQLRTAINNGWSPERAKLLITPEKRKRGLFKRS
jgi:peptidyl-tRNA hydrolase